jgi:hypothetical protein
MDALQEGQIYSVSSIKVINVYSVADPDSGSGAFLPQGSGIWDEFFPDPGSWILDPKHD